MSTIGGVRYQENRPSLIIIGLFVLLEMFVTIHVVLMGFNIVHFILAGFGLLAFLFLFRLKIVIDDECVLLSWGIGAFCRDIAVGDMRAFTLAPNRNIAAWIYNPFGEQIVVIELRAGGRVLVPVTEPKKVMEMLGSKHR